MLLPQVGLYGNTHMLMQDTYSLKVADYLIEWVDKKAPCKNMAAAATAMATDTAMGTIKAKGKH